jgi:hypothetical protein
MINGNDTIGDARRIAEKIFEELGLEHGSELFEENFDDVVDILHNELEEMTGSRDTFHQTDPSSEAAEMNEVQGI